MSAQDTSTPDDTERIEDVDVSSEMQTSFLEYAYSVIYARALPDARDGLKPVQRRILYMMSEMGLRPDRGHVKSARVTGEVMGKLHPHGDSAIYDALVRLAQDFTLRLPLVDGHGNFGSLDDGPAAARYTEARLAAAALAMTENLDEDVVDFVPNYDNQLTQPDVLPAAIPNLLVNGASGIAVGMATNMAPHNLIEVVEAAKHLLEHPDADLEALMRFVPGPDLPSGGTIVGLDGIKEAYAGGRGSFKTRARVSIEHLTARRMGLVVTELPYLIGPEKVIEKIKDGVTSKKLTGISSVDDLSDMANATRLVIGIKTGFDPAAVLEQLYRHTPLEDSFSINNVALVDGGPQTLGLRELLEVYLRHRIEVVTRRSRHRLARRRERLHLVEGLLVAILDIDEVIQLIRSSDDTDQARGRLVKVFDLSTTQADYILELRLRRLTKFSRLELEAERDQLQQDIAALEELLGSEHLIRTQVAAELDTVAEKYGTPRRTVLAGAAPATPASRSASKAPATLEIADAPCRVVLSTTGLLLRVDTGTDSGEEPITPPRRRTHHDAVLAAVDTTVRAELGAVTDRGRILRFSPVSLPAAGAHSVQLRGGVSARAYLGLTDPDEHVLCIVASTGTVPLALGTRRGVVKRLNPDDWARATEFQAIALKPGDRVVAAACAPDHAQLVFVTSDARLLRFSASTVRAQGRTAAGMAGIRLADGTDAIAFAAVTEPEEATVVSIASDSGALAGTAPGSAKRSAFTEYPAKGRATAGVRCHRFLKGEDRLGVAWVGRRPPHALDAAGAPCTLPDEESRRDGSGERLDSVIATIGASLA